MTSKERPWPPGFAPSRLRGRIVVLTGAGVSVESGLPTFRGAGGIYEGRKVEDLATPEGFTRNPELVWEWYRARIAQVLAARPNEGHLALARWEKAAASLILVTSNVDDLHERAGSSPHKLHGSILETRDIETGRIAPYAAPPEGLPRSPEGRLLRPNVVWFGEMACRTAFDAAVQGISRADLVVEAGISGQVGYGFTELALQRRVPVVRINPDEGGSWGTLVHWRESAASALPYLADLATA